MQFPAFVYYKHPRGTFSLSGFGPVRFEQVHDEAGMALALERDGSFLYPPAIDETSPPTRAELEHKAKEIGLTFHHKTGNAKLLAMIEEALA